MRGWLLNYEERDAQPILPKVGAMSDPNICAKHIWKGYGECPSCAGEALGRQIAEDFRKRLRSESPAREEQ